MKAKMFMTARDPTPDYLNSEGWQDITDLGDVAGGPATTSAGVAPDRRKLRDPRAYPYGIYVPCAFEP